MSAGERVTDEVVDVGGRPARVWVGGSGPPLLLLHGGTGDAQLHWSGVWEALAGTATVVAPDLPGFGRTAPLARCTFTALVDFARDVVDAVRPGAPYSVVGNSFGGGVARFLAAAEPIAVRRLVLVDGGAVPQIPAAVLPVLGSRVLDPAFGAMRTLAFSRRGLNRLAADPATWTDDRLASARRDAHAFVASMRQAATDPLPAADRPEQPTLVVWGARDRLTPPTAGRALAAALPDARFVLLLAAGHLPMLEAPTAFVREVEVFVGQAS